MLDEPHVVRASALRVVTLHCQHSSSSFQTSINSGAHRTEIRKLNNASQSTGTTCKPIRSGASEVLQATYLCGWTRDFGGRDSSLFDAGDYQGGMTRMVLVRRVGNAVHRSDGGPRSFLTFHLEPVPRKL